MYCSEQMHSISRPTKVPDMFLEITKIKLDKSAIRIEDALCLAAPAGACHSASSYVAALDKGEAIVCELRLAVDQMAHSDPAPLFATVH